MRKKIIQLIVAIALIVAGIILLGKDFMPFVQWWIAVAILGLIFMPITTHIFSSFQDKGFLFSKTIGIAVTGYLMWLFSSLRILKFTKASCIISVVVVLLLNITFVYWQKRKKKEGGTKTGISNLINKELLGTFLTEELLFFALFLVFTYIRGFKPEAYGTEKFMDYGFMTSMMKSDYMPPQDLWFSGTNLNYYYVGQYLATFLTKLSFVKVSYGYNLMLMMCAAFAFVLPYSLILNVTLQFCDVRAKMRKALSVVSGITAGVGVCIAGNMHYPIFKWWIPDIQKLLGQEPEKYWFPDATRFIGYHPETNDKTIHEFPSYSFVLGDLHAHVINILFVLTLLGILFAWLSSRQEAKQKEPTVWQEIFHPVMLMAGFMIGLFHTTNFWDFPIYYVVSGAVILFSNMIVYNFKGKAYWLTACQGVFIIAFAQLVCLPFTLNFDQISTRLNLVEAHSPMYQLVILWGLPISMVIGFFLFLIADFLRREKKMKKTAEKRKPAVFRLMETCNTSDLFLLILGFCAIGLILLPEIIYVQDIYSGDYKRANTMFKLTYQAYIMFGLCFGYLFVRLICFGTTKLQKVSAGIGAVLFLFTVCYFSNAVQAWYGNIFDHKGYKGIDATAFMKSQMPDDEKAIAWLNDNVTGRPVVLEANGDSYTDYERVSVMTGLPTVLGWRTHEWLWKSDPKLLDARAKDIEAIYTSVNESEVRDLIQKYDISYLYVGKQERIKYTNLNETMLKGLGSVVYQSPTDAAYNTYIIKVNYLTKD